jgi:hypothetical protein
MDALGVIPSVKAAPQTRIYYDRSVSDGIPAGDVYYEARRPLQPA